MTSPIHANAAGEAHDHTETCLAFPPGALAAGITRYAAGSVLSGKYRLDSLLGEGGMGAVWRATNTLLDLPVAIKLIRADLDRNALRARLQLEARSVAKLGHPAIVRIYDVGETEQGDPFIVMELLEGKTLAEMLGQGRLSAVHAVQLLLPIIDACAVAHARGIVHRDLKPDNLLIARDEHRVQPKILDFGIAKLTDPREIDLRLTEIGTVVGSPDYMSPEQARGQDDVDYRTDIWSVCVVLYEAVTGRVPFNAPNYNALLRAIVEDDPRPLTDFAAGDLQLSQILCRGLAKSPEARYPSMGELGHALALWLLSHGIQEDACGTSLEAKWLSRASDPALLSGGTEDSLPGLDASRKRTHDSNPNADAVDSRGPFTATIRPEAAARTRVRRVSAAAALVGALALALLLAPRRSTPSAEAASWLGQRSEHALPPPAPKATLAHPIASAATVEAPPQVSPAPVVAIPVSALPVAKAPAAASVARGLQTAPAQRAASRRAVASTAPATAIAPRPAASARPKPSELDLISPY
jgi:serine/threonine-protein kinase